MVSAQQTPTCFTFSPHGPHLQLNNHITVGYGYMTIASWPARPLRTWENTTVPQTEDSEWSTKSTDWRVVPPEPPHPLPGAGLESLNHRPPSYCSALSPGPCHARHEQHCRSTGGQAECRHPLSRRSSVFPALRQLLMWLLTGPAELMIMHMSCIV